MKIAPNAAGVLAAVMTCAFWVGSGSAKAAEGTSPVAGLGHFDHIFLIMMENHAYGQVIGNPSMPFFNDYAKSANLATNYFAVGHPSLTNYLEIVGGSNFGVRNDNSPNWHASACVPGHVYLETDGTSICPLAGVGTDAETPAIDTTNESPPNATIDVDGSIGFAAAPATAKTIADQLVANGKSWKAYEESLPPSGADGVNSADGLFSNLSLKSNGTTPASSTYVPTSQVFNGVVQGLYAVKHNPFAYFAAVQSGSNPKNSFNNMVGFDGTSGLFADLARGKVPDLAYIVPNQCNDQHGRSGGSAGPACDYDTTDNGTLTGLNPSLMYQGDVTLQRIVEAIKGSTAWTRGRNAIVVVWDENDYSIAPTTNQVALVIDTSDGGHEGRFSSGSQSNRFYTSFSLLKSMEAALDLPCLNHACDANVPVMWDLFAAH